MLSSFLVPFKNLKVILIVLALLFIYKGLSVNLMLGWLLLFAVVMMIALKWVISRREDNSYNIRKDKYLLTEVALQVCVISITMLLLPRLLAVGI